MLEDQIVVPRGEHNVSFYLHARGMIYGHSISIFHIYIDTLRASSLDCMYGKNLPRNYYFSISSFLCLNIPKAQVSNNLIYRKLLTVYYFTYETVKDYGGSFNPQ